MEDIKLIMRWSKEFENYGSGNKHYLKGSKNLVVIIQWNTGKNKNFVVEYGFNHKHHIVSIPGKGDEAMKKAIELAYKVAEF